MHKKHHISQGSHPLPLNSAGWGFLREEIEAEKGVKESKGPRPEKNHRLMRLVASRKKDLDLF